MRTHMVPFESLYKGFGHTPKGSTSTTMGRSVAEGEPIFSPLDSPIVRQGSIAHSRNNVIQATSERARGLELNRGKCRREL